MPGYGDDDDDEDDAGMGDGDESNGEGGSADGNDTYEGDDAAVCIHRLPAASPGD